MGWKAGSLGGWGWCQTPPGLGLGATLAPPRAALPSLCRGPVSCLRSPPSPVELVRLPVVAPSLKRAPALFYLAELGICRACRSGAPVGSEQELCGHSLLPNYLRFKETGHKVLPAQVMRQLQLSPPWNSPLDPRPSKRLKSWPLDFGTPSDLFLGRLSWGTLGCEEEPKKGKAFCGMEGLLPLSTQVLGI